MDYDATAENGATSANVITGRSMIAGGFCSPLNGLFAICLPPRMRRDDYGTIS
jgi:hypothetical protein